MCTSILERLKCSKLNGFSLYTPFYAVLRTHPTTIFFGSCPEKIPSLKADKDPAGIVNNLQSTRFIGKYMLFFLWTFANAKHTSGLTLHFYICGVYGKVTDPLFYVEPRQWILYFLQSNLPSSRELNFVGKFCNV